MNSQCVAQGCVKILQYKKDHNIRLIIKLLNSINNTVVFSSLVLTNS